MTRTTLIAGLIACATIVVVVACGGQEISSPPGPGYVDDAGVAHYPDGGIVAPQGGACAGYDSAAFANIDLSSARTCSNDTDCEKWLNAHAPPNYATNPTCNSGVCFADFLGSYSKVPPYVNNAGTPSCTPGPLGDVYCAALFNQFVMGDGHVSASCVHRCVIVSPENDAPYCESGSDYYVCTMSPIPGGGSAGYCDCTSSATSSVDLCVYRGDSGTATCEVPCAPPPASDGGLDQ